MEKKAVACIPGGECEAITTRMEPFSSSAAVSVDTGRKKKNREMYGPWSKLPNLTIEMILDRLDFVEKFRFASVCVSWRDAAPDFAKRRPQRIIPWLLFSHDTQTEALGFFNLPETMIHHVRIPRINMNFCCGSTEGWLFMFVDDTCEDHHCFLLNPLTKRQIQLPPFTHEPPQSVLKVILSASPDINEDWMVVAYTESHGLLFCKSGGRSWFIGPRKSRIAFSFDDGDIIFSGGKVYGLGMLNSVWAFDMTTQKHALMGGGVSPPYDLYHTYESTDRIDQYISYLVESNGELFLVARCLKNTSSHYTTFKFLLYKLKENDDENLRRMKYVWVRQSSFGAHQAMFLSRNGSKAVSTIESPGLQSNSIYFINDLHPQTGKPCDIGIYHVEDGTIEPFVPFDSCTFKFPSVWVTPSV
ncbi:hypothetical protein NE237_000912 [Protea cynaroides]|uniref:F-box domain-containing protein n=1 Tax=Protea cynaroides TaxID=273540 RepID=A0A9Q0KSD2_9MAGN|nr:hypothetical protein NE237_000912 [Protea cynaroides]